MKESLATHFLIKANNLDQKLLLYLLIEPPKCYEDQIFVLRLDAVSKTHLRAIKTWKTRPQLKDAYNTCTQKHNQALPSECVCVCVCA